MYPLYGQIDKWAIQSITKTMRPKRHAPPLLILRARTGVFQIKMRIKLFKFLSNLEEDLVIYSNK